MKIPYYLLASALCLAVAIGACNEGPTDVADEASLSGDEATLSAKQPQVDICHWDGDLNEGAGAFVHLTVNGNSWSNGGDGCGGKVNPNDKQVGHNGHELDTNWNSDTTFVAEECEMFCFEDRDGDGLTDDVDPCIFDADNDSDGDGVCLSDGDTCFADPADNDGGTDTDGDGWCDDNDNCVDDPNDQVDSDSDGLGDVCDDCPDDADNDIDGDGLCANVDVCPSEGELDCTGDEVFNVATGCCELIE